MSYMSRTAVLFLVALFPLVGKLRAEEEQEAPNAAGVEFFETHIRPVLVKQCYQCHAASSEKTQGGLLLDSREGLLEGGDSGPALVPGKPDDSLILSALRHESFEMPPDKRLDDRVIAKFEQWIRLGAPDPRKRAEDFVKKARVLYSQADADSHWAFQPLARVAVPEQNDSWVKTPIDAFILQRLKLAGLKPSPPAEPEILLRRATYDLTGLPPSLAEVKAFTANDSQTAFTETIQRLLDSPRYGEKWGRHWLDIARYADTNGERQAPTKSAPFYPFAWTYRDYVIDAFNRDLPFDEFIREQIAGDYLATPHDRRPLAAMGFVRVGKAFGQNLDDRIDDRIDALTKGFLGLTVTCARCHDHKFDPVFQDDYYALHGVFASSEEADVVLHNTAGTPAHADFERERQQIIDKIDQECRDGLNDYMHRLTLDTARYLLGVEAFRDGLLTEKKVPDLAARELDLPPIIFQSWLRAFERWDNETPPTWQPWRALAALDADAFAAKAPDLCQQIAAGKLGEVTIPPVVAKAFAGQKPQTLADVAEIYQQIFFEVEKAANGRYPLAELLCAIERVSLFRKEYYQHPALPPKLDDPQMEAVRQVTIGLHGPLFMTPRELMQSGAGDIRKRKTSALHAVVALEGEHPGAPVLAMTLRDLSEPVNSPIYIRGERENPGEEVPRRFLRNFGGEQSGSFQQGSGRLELADAIASRDNPLTARVIVNRVWQWHFGQGLVSTPSDFGLRSEPPSHPELLDWLAGWFMDNDWSIKTLHRLIMNSSVYQQSSLRRTECVEIDPENTLLWRMNPRRLTFEELRDTVLTAAGTLTYELGGRPVDPLQNTTHRTVYLEVDRYDLPDMFSTFDFATPEFTTAERDSTIVPQQALFLMNQKWLMDRARDLASRAEVAQADGVLNQVTALYRILFQRSPDEEERKLATEYLSAFPDSQHEVGLARLAHALLLTNELVYIR